MKKLLYSILLISILIALTNCSKVKEVVPKINDTEFYISAKINGTDFKYNNDLSNSTDPKVLNVFNSTLNTLNLGMYSQVTLGSGSSNIGSFAISVININLDNISIPLTVTAGSDFTGTYPTISYVDQNGNTFEAMAKEGDSLPYVTLQISSKSNDIIEGNFSGIMYDLETTNTKKVVTEGKFRIKITR